MNPISFGSTFKIINPNGPVRSRIFNDIVNSCEEKGYCVYDSYVRCENGNKVVTTIDVPDEVNESLGAYLLKMGIGFSISPKSDEN